jgi:transcriptional regulator with XRE-family HTH domain
MSPKDPTEIDRLEPGALGQGARHHGAAAAKVRKGRDRIGASRLHKLAGVLDVPIGYFFEGHAGAGASKTGAGEAEMCDQPDPSVFADRETVAVAVAVAVAFNRIACPAMRRALLELARAAAHLDRASRVASAGEAGA